MGNGSFAQGDIIWLDLNPQTGHEQGGRRPALIISKTNFLKVTKKAMVCPITNTDNGFPLHLELPETCETKGFILCEQAKILDIYARNAEFKEKIDRDTLMTALDMVTGIIEPD